MKKERFSLFSLFVLIIVAWGGLLYGYHTAILSGILNRVKTDFNLTILDEGILTSIILLGGLAGAIMAGAAADKWGRKKILLVTAVIFSCGSLMQAFSISYGDLLAGRFLTGIGVGVASVVGPLYLAEIAPPHFRGSFVCTFQLMVASGVLLAYAINLEFEHFKWNFVFYIAFIPSFIQFFTLFVIPETPAWLMHLAQKTNAVHTIDALRDDDEWKKHLHEMQKIDMPLPTNKTKPRLQSHLKRLVLIGITLSVFQQITGVNTVFYFAPKIFSESAGSSHAGLLITFIIGIVNVLSTIISVWLLDRLGRRTFLLIGVLAMIVGQALLIFATQSPAIGILGAMIYVIGFAIGLGPITWVFLSEIYPLSIRGKAMGLALFANWLFNATVSLTFLLLIKEIGQSWTFLFYGLLSLLCLIFVYFFIPETKGKSLEEIELLAAKGKL